MFQSKAAPLIWDKLYDVMIPDQLTLDPAYIKIFGTHVTGNSDVDKMVGTNFTHVKICIARMVQYYEDGVEIQIPNREDMIRIHKDIEEYLSEWREHLRVDINLQIGQNKHMVLLLERLSKDIYNKAKVKEVVNTLFVKEQIGLVNPIERMRENRKTHTKPDYEGIRSLVQTKTNKPFGRF